MRLCFKSKYCNKGRKIYWVVQFFGFQIVQEVTAEFKMRLCRNPFVAKSVKHWLYIS